MTILAILVLAAILAAAATRSHFGPWDRHTNAQYADIVFTGGLL